MKRKTIMVVDDNSINLSLARDVLKDSYDVLTFSTAVKALSALSELKPDLILLDIEMPKFNGFKMMECIKVSRDYKNIPVIFVTARNDADSELKGLKMGAVDYINKPFSAPLLLKRVEIHLRLMDQKKQLMKYNAGLEKLTEEKTEIIRELQYAIIHTIADLMEKRDMFTGGHIFRTKSYLSTMMEAALNENVYGEELAKLPRSLLVQASQLHDLGKIATPDRILLKSGKLNPEEFEEMKLHTIIGSIALDNAMRYTRDKEFLYYAKVLAISHHERWDGTGYPNQLKGLDIPLVGRIMAIVDVYDALVSKRPYKEPVSHEKAVRIIESYAGTHFDPQLVKVFLKSEKYFDEIAQVGA